MSFYSGDVPKAHGGARPKIRKSAVGLPVIDQVPVSSSESSSICNIDEFQKNNFSNSNSSISHKIDHEQQITTEPLDKKKVTLFEGGVQVSRDALHQNFAEKKTFVSYVAPPLQKKDEVVIGATEAWIEQMEFMIDDLNWLLNLSHHRFWSQMVYDKSVHGCLDSYIGYGPRWYDKLPEDETSINVMTKIHQLVFLIYVRMATHKESVSDHISPPFFGDLIYDNFIFDLCKIIDLCALYGSTNKSLLEKMLDNIFKCKPAYFKDLEQLVISLEDILQNIQMKLQRSNCANQQVYNGVVLLADEAFSLEEIEDITQYLLDSFSSVHSFLTLFTQGRQTFRRKEFHLGLCCFYEQIVPILLEKLSIYIIEFGKDSFSESFTTKINSLRTSCLAVFRLIITESCLPKDDYKTSDEMGTNVENFIQILSTCAEEKMFITDYSSTYDIDQDIQLYEKAGADMTTLNFLREAISSAVTEVEASSHSWSLAAVDELPASDPSNKDSSGMNGYYAGEMSSISDIEMASLISSVQDLLPDLGSGFVEECLRYYNYSTEEVLNALLENNLPERLSSLDRTLAVTRTTKKVKNTADAKKPDLELSTSDVLVNRANVYNDDAFDVFSSARTKSVRMDKVFKGKRKDEIVEKDSSLTDKIKAIASEYDAKSGYSIYDDEEKYRPLTAQNYDDEEKYQPLRAKNYDDEDKYKALTAQNYDDEYDDTYDDYEPGGVDIFSADKRQRRNVAPPTIYGKGALNTPGMNFLGDSSQDEDNCEDGAPPPEDPFSIPELNGRSVVFNNSARRRPTRQYLKSSYDRKQSDAKPQTFHETRRRTERQKILKQTINNESSSTLGQDETQSDHQNVAQKETKTDNRSLPRNDVKNELRRDNQYENKRDYQNESRKDSYNKPNDRGKDYQNSHWRNDQNDRRRDDQNSHGRNDQNDRRRDDQNSHKRNDRRSDDQNSHWRNDQNDRRRDDQNSHGRNDQNDRRRDDQNSHRINDQNDRRRDDQNSHGRNDRRKDDQNSHWRNDQNDRRSDDQISHRRNDRRRDDQNSLRRNDQNGHITDDPHWSQSGGRGGQQEETQTGRHKMHSGKGKSENNSWSQENNENVDDNSKRGGKCKEDSNVGKGQNQKLKNKSSSHKGDHRRYTNQSRSRCNF